MKSVTLYSKKSKPKKLAQDLLEQVPENFQPDLIFFFVTLKYKGHYQEILNILESYFYGVPQIGCTTDVMFFPGDISTDGATLTLCKNSENETDTIINVQCETQGSTIEITDKLCKKIECENGFVLLFYPFVYIPKLKTAMLFWAKGRYYSMLVNKENSKEKKIQIASEFQQYCEKARIFYPADIHIEKVANALERKVPVIGVMTGHTKLTFETPSMFCNFKDIKGSVVALTIEKTKKENIEIIYDAIYDEKPEMFEEFLNNIKTKITLIEKVNVLKYKNILIEINGEPVVKETNRIVMSENIEEKNLENLIKKGINPNYPYALYFFDEQKLRFNGSAVGSYYPFDLFPISQDLTEFPDRAFISQERASKDHNIMIKGAYQVKNVDQFNFFVLDIGSIMMYGEKTFDYNKKIYELFKDNYLGIMTSPVCVFLPDEFIKKRYSTETKDNIFNSAFGTSVYLSF